jgi:hypothetical protein
VPALYIRAILSILPMMKKEASGDQARSYISVPSDRHICFVRQASLSSKPSDPKATWWFSEGTHNITLPSSPADARSSPLGAQRTTFTACVCFASVARYSTFRSSPSSSIFQSYRVLVRIQIRFPSGRTRTLLSPAPVANRPFPCGSKCAE